MNSHLPAPFGKTINVNVVTTNISKKKKKNNDPISRCRSMIYTTTIAHLNVIL